ncbi:MAG: hypothetical protein SF162_17110 [bacterium]|nr:hypothetical protein [bacterium]
MTGRGRARSTARRRAGGGVITAFTQSWGAETVANGDFSAWTNDNPDGWTLTGETGAGQQVTQCAPDGSAGTGAARFVSSASLAPQIAQNLLAAGTWYELGIDVSAFTSGLLRTALTANLLFSSAGTKTALGRVAANGSLALTTNGAAAHDFVIDRVSLRPVTLNAVHPGAADGTHTLRFTLPATPPQGARIELRYRVQDDQNYWVAALVRGNTWDLQVNSVNAGAATNRISVTNVGTPDAIRVVTAGALHTAFTGVSDVYTQRGAPVNITHLNALTGVTAVYTTGFTPLALSSGG